MVLKYETYPNAAYQQQQAYMVVRESDGYSQNGHYNGSSGLLGEHVQSQKSPLFHVPTFQQGHSEPKQQYGWGHAEQKYPSESKQHSGWGHDEQKYHSEPKQHSGWGHDEQKYHSEPKQHSGWGHDEQKYHSEPKQHSGWGHDEQKYHSEPKLHSGWGYGEQKYHSGSETSPGYGNGYFNSAHSAMSTGGIPHTVGYTNHYQGSKYGQMGAGNRTEKVREDYNGWGNDHSNYSYGSNDMYGHAGNKQAWTLKGLEDDE